MLGVLSKYRELEDGLECWLVDTWEYLSCMVGFTLSNKLTVLENFVHIFLSVCLSISKVIFNQPVVLVIALVFGKSFTVDSKVQTPFRSLQNPAFVVDLKDVNLILKEHGAILEDDRIRIFHKSFVFIASTSVGLVLM